MEETLFDRLDRQEAARAIQMPPTNAFQEMARWTRENKMHRYPIDNDDGACVRMRQTRNFPRPNSNAPNSTL